MTRKMAGLQLYASDENGRLDLIIERRLATHNGPMTAPCCQIKVGAITMKKSKSDFDYSLFV